MLGTNAVHRVRSHIASASPSATQPARSHAYGRVSQIAVAAIAGVMAIVLSLGVLFPRALLAGSAAAGIIGLAATLAGLVLLVVAFRDAGRGRRWYVKLLALPVGLVLVQWVFVPAVNAGLVTNAPRDHSPDVDTLGLPFASNVYFRARDGVPLRGWFVAGRSHATVIVLHGSHGSRSDVLDQIRMLSDRGYSVLAYDARGHGESGGRTNALGWDGDDDLAGAVAFLRRRPDVDRQRIAALGLSMGAEQALRAAGDGLPLRAVVADGAGASTLGDLQIVSRGLNAPVADSVTRLTMGAVSLISRQPEPAALKKVVEGIHVPVLLISSNRRDELAVDEEYAARVGADATIWYVADVGHTQAYRKHPEAYAARVSAFLAHALGPTR